MITDLLDEQQIVLETAYIEVLDRRETANSQTVTTAASKNALSGGNAIKTPSTAEETKKIKVQFNPASLDLSVDGGGTKTKKDITGAKTSKKKIKTEPNMPANANMSVNLIFDRTIYIDANVMPEVEGFLAILKNPYTRQINFHWGNLYYKGRLTSVNADYTMFQPSGIPVRANVTLRMEILK